MRQIEERITVIGPGAIVRLKKEAAPRLADRMARWRVLGCLEDVIRVEDVEDIEDTRTFNLEDVERVSGGVEVVDSTLCSDSVEQYPEHDKWPACLRQEFDADFVDPEQESGSLFDDPEALLEEDEEEDS